MTDRLAPLVAYALFVAFFAILLWRVPRLDLGLVVVIGLALAGWDVLSQARRR